MQVRVSEIGLNRILRVFHIVMRHSWEFTALPSEMTHVEGVMERPEEKHTVGNECKLIDVPQLHWILGFDHFNLLL